jgi:outer membrane protein assembly factor BamB
MRISISRCSALFLLLAFTLLSAVARGQDKTPQTFRFIHITDTHLTANGNIEPLKKLVADINAMDPAPAFVIDTGDVTEAGRPEEFQRFLEGTTGLKVPFYCAPGNHDTRWGPLGKEAFSNAFKKLYQSFDYGGCHFVILDSTVLLEHWGHFDASQLEWLEKDLKKLKKETPVFLFFHHWVGRERNMVDNQERLLRIIAPYNVVGMFVGHGHSDIQWKVNGIDCFMARGLYQGSYNIVDVDPGRVDVRRWRKENGDKEPAVITSIPLKAGHRRQVAFLWDDPNVPLLARRRPLAELREGDAKVARDERVKAAYSIDGGEVKPMVRDIRDTKSVSFMAQFETKGLGNGTHILRVILTTPDGEVYTREEPFVVEQLSGQPKRAWEQPYKTGDTIQSSPILVEDTLYVSSFDGKVYALDPASGKRKWAASTGGPIFATPLVAEGTVYVGSMDHYLYAFDARTGKPRWKFDAGTPLFATAGLQDGVVCIGANERIFGVEVRTGKEKWTQPAGSFFQSRAASADGVFYLGGWDNTLYALDAQTGQPRWTAKMGRANGGKGALSFYYSPAITSPTVAEGRVFVCTNDGTLHAVNAKTGQDEWTARAPGDSFGYSSPLYVDGKIYLGGLGPNGDIYAVSAKDGSLLWRCTTGAENYDSSPAMAGRFVVIGSVQGKLSWIDVESGQLKYQYALDPGYCFSSPAATPRMTYITSMNGTVDAILLP